MTDEFRVALRSYIVMIVAHIAGIPVEETALALGSAGVAGIGTALRLIDAKRRRSRSMAPRSSRLLDRVSATQRTTRIDTDPA